jgi:NitT/TauT family transport system permease protein
VVMATLMCFLPVALSTLAGLTSTPAELVDLAQSLCASRRHTFLKIRLPAAVPQIMTGLKTAMPLAVVGAVVGELFGASRGLGYAIQAAGADASWTFAVAAVLAVMAVALHYALVAAGRLLAPWVPETTVPR